jgi:hypothetical protein
MFFPPPYIFLGGLEPGPLLLMPLLAYCTSPSAALSTTNPTLPDPGSNPGRRGWKPAANSLSYGTAMFFPLFQDQSFAPTQTIGKIIVLHISMFTFLGADEEPKSSEFKYQCVTDVYHC